MVDEVVVVVMVEEVLLLVAHSGVGVGGDDMVVADHHDGSKSRPEGVCGVAGRWKDLRGELVVVIVLLVLL